MKNWPARYIFAFILFIVGIVFAIYNVIGINTHPADVGPGSGLGVFAPIVGAIVGYILGGIVDMFSRK